MRRGRTARGERILTPRYTHMYLPAARYLARSHGVCSRTLFTRYRCYTAAVMTIGTLIYPMLVLALTGIVFATAWRSATPVRAFRGGFIWAFMLVLFTPWVGAYSAESAVVNGSVAGLLAVGMWWVIQTRLRPGKRAAVTVRPMSK